MARAARFLSGGPFGWQYLLAALFVAVAWLSREQLLPEAGDKAPFQTFVLAALLSALTGGLGPGLFATALGAAIAIYLYLPPFHALAIDASSDVLRLVLFAFEGVLSSVAGEAVRRAANRERDLGRTARRFRQFLRHASETRVLPESEPGAFVESLSERELEVVRFLALGLRNDEISRRLFVSRNTVKTHLAHIYGKLGVRTRTEAVARCIDLGLLLPLGEPESSPGKTVREVLGASHATPR